MTSKGNTIRDVARAAGVSLGTVSRVLNGNPTVSPAVRESVLHAARTLGYVPNAIAQSMRTHATRAIGCMVSDVANPLFSSVVKAVERVAHRASYNIVLANSADDLDREQDILGLFRRRRLDGVLMTLGRDDDPRTLAMVQKTELPTVLIERELSAEIDSVRSDHFQGTAYAVEHLFALGHTRIGLITVTTGTLPGRLRVSAYEDCYRKAKLTVDPTLIFTSGISQDYGFAAASDLLLGSSPPTAIIAGANQMVGVLKAARACNVSVPENLSVICLGDTDLAELFEPPLTVVRWDPQKVGEMAATMLLERLSPEGARLQHRKLTLPTELVVRESCTRPKLD